MANDKTPTILIADDDHQALSILKQIMMGQGLNVITASDGNSTREMVSEQKPDLVILDNYMPGVSGSEICREIKDDPKTRLIPVVMLTGYTETPDKLEAIEAGADDFINKPYKAVELITRIKSLLKVKFLNDELDSAEEVIFSLAKAIEAKDEYTKDHTARVSQLALAMGHQLKLSAEEQDALYKGGILHDVGKIGIPDGILNKPGRLTDEEFAAIRTHPAVGEGICKPLKSMRIASKIVRHHHEKLDGSGYPDKISGDQIPVVARIMAIVDVYDALTSVRSYRTALPQDKAFGILEEESNKGWWDKELLATFKSIVTV
ncbi:MAG TPA: hypothetical protein DEE98_08540 [Elusimicrobia bacterium]|nr:MAG: hypothetical protein A2278_05130 [Elusimicrobia bacterium RIFOXYA12_FULL_49_49]OGS09274.1 MAG: hypothetical protein A2386_02475 [Elusimicrobia bacterium RIFOXYB1_FULL_48_9]OGS15213.1 MAG: hypothetical protein A2251_06860 [Elusimicrobia bacterium RIFOXYA2_FULL_47_53]OGS25932.1 MAG: hypothetical protein A2339_00945 [Elusimicrobia bacterium RIFOXYB12_FULL_50_12]OGS30264.1 MAG: hypothetical protein A2323_05435 [Elusimicrobia bacterium RIFOXYB2_FULL_46_23]HBU70409.1 hypothetical protein [El